MNLKEKLCLLGFVSKIMAAHFAVVSFNGKCKLSVGDTTYSMSPELECPNLYTASVDVPVNSKYKYICGGKEDVERTLYGETTHNELFGRALTSYKMPEFSYPDSEPWSRSIGRTELFDPSYVPIVIIDTDKEFFVNASGGKFNKITFILKDNVFSFNNVYSSCKNDDEDKFQFKIALGGDDNIYNRNVFKFRPSAYDPTLIRQILYGDIAHAIGNPAHESVAARVYHSDGTGIGLYVLQEDTTTESFIKTAFYGRSDGSIRDYKLSPIYDCSTGADFNPDDPHQLGSFQNDESELTDFKIELKEMMRKLVAADVSNPDEMKNIDENFLDLDTLLKAIALEYLAGHWDSYWFLTSNFVTYHPAEETEGTLYNYSKYKYYFIDQDFDQTWSVGMNDRLDPVTFPTKQYTEFVNKDADFWKKINYDEIAEPGTRVIINHLIGCDGLSTCYTKDLFEKHLKSIVKYIFNPDAMGEKVNGYKERLDEEMEWDTSLTRLHKGTLGHYHFTYKDFIRGLETGVTSSYGIMDWTRIISDTVCNQFNMACGSNPSSEVNDSINDSIDDSINDSTTSSDDVASAEADDFNPVDETISSNEAISNPLNSGEDEKPMTKVSNSSEAIKNKISLSFILFTIALTFVLN